MLRRHAPELAAALTPAEGLIRGLPEPEMEEHGNVPAVTPA